MSVLRIEEYGDVLKIVLKPTKKFPEGYFYTDDNEITRELIESYSWFLHHCGRKNINVSTSSFNGLSLKFHREYAYRVLGYYPDYIDHIDGLEINNLDRNLNIVNNIQNVRNKPSRGYDYCKIDGRFIIHNNINVKKINRGSYHNEFDAIHIVYLSRLKDYSDYNYNFLLDRRDDSDIVDLELTGQITQEQATEMHVRKYVENNPWYVYRYGLEDYCKEHDILVPDFDIDSQGFMINPVTRQRLCPY